MTTDAVAHSVEDAEGLLNTLLLLSALMFAFAVTLETGTFTVEDFETADGRYLQFENGKSGRERFSPDIGFPTDLTLGGYNLISYRFIKLGSLCLFFLMMSLIIATGCYISLLYSNAREDKNYFQMWFKWFSFPILLGYLFFIVGMFLFFHLNHTAIDIAYPMYPNMNISFDQETGLFASDPYLAGRQRFEGHAFYAPHQQFAFRVIQAMYPVISLMAVLVLGIHVVVSSKPRVAEPVAATEVPAAKYPCFQDTELESYIPALVAANIDFRDLAKAVRKEQLGLVDTVLKDGGVEKAGDRLKMILLLVEKADQ